MLLEFHLTAAAITWLLIKSLICRVIINSWKVLAGLPSADYLVHFTQKAERVLSNQRAASKDCRNIFRKAFAAFIIQRQPNQLSGKIVRLWLRDGYVCQCGRSGRGYGAVQDMSFSLKFIHVEAFLHLQLMSLDVEALYIKRK